jgi:hypothetical protein
MDSYQYDSKMVFDDGLTPHTAGGLTTIAAAAMTPVDMGGAPDNTTLGVIGGFAALRAVAVIDVTAAKITATTDNIYTIFVLGSNIAAGTDPVVLGALALGYGTTLPNGAHSAGGAPAGTGSDSHPGRYIILFQTEQADIKYEFIYGYVVVVGTNPSITFGMFVSMFPVE